MRMPAMRMPRMMWVLLPAVYFAAKHLMDSRKTKLPMPGEKKQDPEELDRMLDSALEDSMGPATRFS